MNFRLLLAVVFLASARLPAQESIEQTSNGFRIKVGEAQVELAAVSADILRLSVAGDGKVDVAESTFLAPRPPGNVNWSRVSTNGLVGVQTDRAELLINPTNGDWSLLNAEGNVLIPSHPLGYRAIKTAFYGAEASESQIISLGWAPQKHDAPGRMQVYGCGNAASSLQQSEGRTSSGNGVATIPFYWAPSGYSVLAVSGDDNKPASWQPGEDLKSLVWTFPGKTADLYLMPSSNLREAEGAYARASGAALIPPRWTFGYLQSRWGWKDRAYIEDTLKHFRDLKLPLDGFIYDFEWYTPKPDYEVPPAGLEKFPDFGFNPGLFPSPAQQIAAYKQEGVHSIGIRKPRMGDRDTLVMMHEKGWSLNGGKKDELYHNRDFDFSNPDAREWYIHQTTAYFPMGLTEGWWNDEGEGNYTLYYYWNLAESEALHRFLPKERFWSLNRSFSPGLQRLGAAMWTGDIKATWPTLERTPTDLLNLGLSGMPFAACDIGGFIGETSPELLARWMQAGVFFPKMRTHSDHVVTPHFPWLFGPAALRSIRKSLELRYRLIPYYYSLAHETFSTGAPMMRPLIMEFPNDTKTANLSDEWLMGRSLLAAPILNPGGKRSVYLPPSARWYRFGKNQVIQGAATQNVTTTLDEIPMYVRAGSILPLGPLIMHTDQLPGGPLEVQIYPGADADFTLVEDDGHTTDYLSGKVRRTMFHWNEAKGELSWKCAGPYNGADLFRDIHAVIFDANGVREMKGALKAEGTLALRSEK